MIGRSRTRWHWQPRPAGHDVSVAASAEEGIKLGLTGRPDVVIADWMLGGNLHGGEVCRRIRATCPAVKTIIMTLAIWMGASDVEQWPQYAETLLEKPFHQEAILEAVNRALSCGAAC